MDRCDVSAVRTPDYGVAAVEQAVRRHFELQGGVEIFVRPGSKVLLKVNLLMSRRSEAVTTTHPALVEAVARVVREAGGSVVIADSPGGPYTARLLERTYRTTGMAGAAERTGAMLNLGTGAAEISFPQGRLCKGFHLIDPWHEADVVISLCKLKTHAMTGYTGAVKNCFGLIPGLEKPQMHFRFQELADFSQMLVDLCLCAAPDLTFMDAVDCMEGDGPSGGTPRHLGLTLCARSPTILDRLMVDLIGFSAQEIWTVRHAIDRGLCPESVADIAVQGEDLAPYACRFRRAASHHLTFDDRIPGPLRRLAKRWFAPRPTIRQDRCVGCGECAANCPPQTIALQNGKAVIDRSRCIRCFCCQEMCPVKAIAIRSNPLMRL